MQKRHLGHCKVKGERGKKQWGGTVKNVQGLDVPSHSQAQRDPKGKRQARGNGKEQSTARNRQAFSLQHNGGWCHFLTYIVKSVKVKEGGRREK